MPCPFLACAYQHGVFYTPMNIKWFKSISSTQKYLINSSPTYKDTLPVVATTLQTRGIGRANNTWLSLTGSLSFSYVAPACIAYIDVIGRVRHVLKDLGVDALCKWPNDVLVSDGVAVHKVCGALIDKIGGHAVVGVGVNLGYACACTTGCKGCIGIDEHEWCTESEDGVMDECRRSCSTTKYKTVNEITGVEIMPHAFVERYFSVDDPLYAYDLCEYVNYNGERMAVIDKRELRLKDMNGKVHVIDPMVYSYDYSGNSILDK